MEFHTEISGMMTLMDHDGNSEQVDEAEFEEENIDWERDDIISFLTYNENICFKNQQRWEADLTIHEKSEIALKIFNENKLQFLMKFGKFLKHDHLCYFKKFTDNVEPYSTEIKVLLDELHKDLSESTNCKKIKNRRFEALRQMVQEDSYFSEIEMMKRNPLLYDQFIGQYMTADEIKERDKFTMNEQTTFVKILMEGIERQDAELCRKQQEIMKDSEIREDTSDEADSRPPTPVPSTSRWGEFEEDKSHRTKAKASVITIHERIFLRKEFITSMYQSFLDGCDKDFNYETVDNDASYDNIEEINNEAEEKYFDTEDNEEESHVDDIADSSEDELEMYMNALNQHPAVCQLSNDMKEM